MSGTSVPVAAPENALLPLVAVARWRVGLTPE